MVGIGTGTGRGLGLGDVDGDELGDGDGDGDAEPGARCVPRAVDVLPRCCLPFALFVWSAFGLSFGNRLTPSWSGVMPA